MKLNRFSAVMAAFILLSNASGFAVETNNVIADINAVIARINEKIVKGQGTEKNMADEINALDPLYAKYKGTKTDDVAQILALKADLLIKLLNDPERAAEALQQLKRDLPETTTGQHVDEILDSLKGLIAAQKIRDSLVAGTKFPDFDEKDLAGKSLSVANYKGKVVLIEFWATWCPPCVAAMPNVLATYRKFHDHGFEIIGVSLDADETALTDFIKKNKLPWPQYFDGQFWSNKLAVKYGITVVPTTFLLDRNGGIVGKNLRGEALAQAVAKAIKEN
jgi:peroxiredoxin